MRSRSAAGLMAATSCLALMSGLMAAPAQASHTTTKVLSFAPRLAKTPTTVPNEVIVRWKPGVSVSSRLNSRRAHGTIKVESVGLARAEKVKVVDGSSVSAAVAELNADPRVDFAQPNFRYTSNTEPLESKLWGLNNTGQTPEANYSGPGAADVDINAPEAWATTTGDSSVVVGIIDTGIDIGHSDLVGATWTNPGEIQNNGIDDDANGFIDDVHGWDFLNNDASVYDAVTCSGGEDEDFHGTHVAGTIAAQRNGMGVVGVAPGVRVMPLKALGCSGGDTGTVIDALNYAKAEGVKIVNMSLGGPGYDQAFKDAIDASGILVVAAAGNGGDDQIGDNNDNPGTTANDFRQYPGGFTSPNILAVAAVNNVGALSSFSNYGPTSTDVAGPGQSVVSDYPRDAYGASQYVFLDGTSMATPHVTGTAALVLSTNLALTPAQMKSRIMSTTRPLPSLSGKILTGGLVDANGAVLGVAAVRQATAMTFSRSTTIITTGQSVRLSTKLTQAGQPQAARTVKLVRYASGWKVACTVRTNSAGVASCLQKPTTNTEYYWRFDGDLGLKSTSYGLTKSPDVWVRPTISMGFSPTRVRTGTKTVVSGKVSPTKAGRYVYLQRRSGTVWQTVTKLKVNSVGVYRFSFSRGVPGTFSYRVHFNGDSRNAAQNSSVRLLRVS